MLLYIMLYVMLAYLMLFAALSNAVSLYDAFFVNALSWFIDTQFVYFMYYFASCTVFLICFIFLILCSHRFFH